jgi:ABC-type transport system substrate-binding protein
LERNGISFLARPRLVVCWRARENGGTSRPTPPGENFPERPTENPRQPSSLCLDLDKEKKSVLTEQCKASVLASTSYDFGAPLPRVNNLTVHIMVERGPMWLKFLKGELDHAEIPKDNFDASVENGELKPELQKKKMVMTADQSSTEWWVGFNMNDPIIGKNKLLRKAMALAFDSKKHNELFGFGMALLSNQILPATVTGFNSKLPPKEYNIEKAKKILALAGYPNGKGLPEFNYDTEGAVLHRQMGEFFKSQMAQIGIKIKVNLHTRPEYFDARKKGKTQIIYDGWIADYPDAENFMQLLYGPNSSPGMNNSSFKNAEYDKLYEKMRDMPDSKERQKIIDQMTAIAAEEQVWIPNWVAKIFNVRQAWLKNYKYSDFGYNVYKYYGVDFEEKERLKQELFSR